MSQIITKRPRLSRRTFLKGMTATQATVIVGLPPLISMFNSTGTAYAADAKLGQKGHRATSGHHIEPAEKLHASDLKEHYS